MTIEEKKKFLEDIFDCEALYNMHLLVNNDLSITGAEDIIIRNLEYYDEPCILIMNESNDYGWEVLTEEDERECLTSTLQKAEISKEEYLKNVIIDRNQDYIKTKLENEWEERGVQEIENKGCEVLPQRQFEKTSDDYNEYIEELNNSIGRLKEYEKTTGENMDYYVNFLNKVVSKYKDEIELKHNSASTAYEKLPEDIEMFAGNYGLLDILDKHNDILKEVTNSKTEECNKYKYTLDEVFNVYTNNGIEFDEYTVDNDITQLYDLVNEHSDIINDNGRSYTKEDCAEFLVNKLETANERASGDHTGKGTK